MNDFYTWDELDRTGANYRIAIGERSAGKTHDFLIKAIKRYAYYGELFFLLRREHEEVTTTIANTWLNMSDAFIEQRDKILHEKFPAYEHFHAVAKTGQFILYGLTEEKPVRLDIIGYYWALSTAHKLKSSGFGTVTSLFYDEFLSDSGMELKGEFERFLNLISTIKRKRENFVIYMGGNTVNRNSKILESMGINVRDLIKGEIRVFDYKSENETGEIVHNTVAIEYTRSYEQSAKSESYFVFNNQSEKMIVRGEWATETYPTFTEHEFYNAKIREAYIFEFRKCRIFIYRARNSKLYISGYRLPIFKDQYIILTDRGTYLNRNCYNFKCGITAVDRLISEVKRLHINGFTRFDNDLTGDDFKTIINNI